MPPKPAGGRQRAAAVRAECPDWEVLNAFAAFSLSSKGGLAQPLVCCLIDIDPQCLRSHFVDCRLTAACTHHDRGMDKLSAWRASVQAVATSSGQAQTRHPRQALDKSRYGASLGASTSNAERSFAALLDAAGLRRPRLSTTWLSSTAADALTRKWACSGARGKSVSNIQAFHLQQLDRPTASGAGAPRTSDFRAVLEHKARGSMSDCGLPAVASGEKLHLMAWRYRFREDSARLLR